MAEVKEGWLCPNELDKGRQTTDQSLYFYSNYLWELGSYSCSGVCSLVLCRRCCDTWAVTWLRRLSRPTGSQQRSFSSCRRHLPSTFAEAPGSLGVCSETTVKNVCHINTTQWRKHRPALEELPGAGGTTPVKLTKQCTVTMEEGGGRHRNPVLGGGGKKHQQWGKGGTVEGVLPEVCNQARSLIFNVSLFIIHSPFPRTNPPHLLLGQNFPRNRRQQLQWDGGGSTCNRVWDYNRGQMEAPSSQPQLWRHCLASVPALFTSFP